MTDEDIDKIAKRVWSYMVGGGGAGATLEEVREVNRDIKGDTSVILDPRWSPQTANGEARRVRRESTPTT